MAEGHASDYQPAKKRRLDIHLLDDNFKSELINAIKFLKRDLFYLSPVKVKLNNGNVPCYFTRSICQSKETPDKFIFPSFFHVGIKKILQFLENEPCHLTESQENTIKRLVNVCQELDELSKVLHDNRIEGTESKPGSGTRQEPDLAIQLAHHLLQPLSSYPTYMMDNNSRNQTQFCQCCEETITGTFGDTSFGNDNVWHGCADILMGHNNDMSIAVMVNEADLVGDQDSKEDQCFPASSIEIKDETSLKHHTDQMMAETIVFGCLQHKLGRSANNFLIPTIGISRKHVRIYFYDAVEDILLISTTLPLFDKRKKLLASTVVALWLCINYPVTCSGLTKLAVEKGEKTEFLKNFDDDVKLIYENELRFGNCHHKFADLDEDFLSTGQFHAELSEPNCDISKSDCLKKEDIDL